MIELTKTALLETKKTVSLAISGKDLIERKKNVLIHEILSLENRAKLSQKCLCEAMSSAYSALQQANVSIGIVKDLSKSEPIDDNLLVSFRNIMGIEIPLMSLEKEKRDKFPPFSIHSSNSYLDKAYLEFQKVKKMLIEYAELEISIFRLSRTIKVTKKKVNALKNIIIPKLEKSIKDIVFILEEREREEFIRMKMIKNLKSN